jgi:hypothetical protein
VNSQFWNFKEKNNGQKASLDPASTRLKNQKIKVEKGTKLSVEEVIKTNDLHDFVKHRSGCCWIYRPHWKIELNRS